MAFLGASPDGCGGTPARPPADGGGAGQGGTGQGGGAASTGCADAGTIVAGDSCSAGSGCPQDPSRPARAVCDCVAGHWHCTFAQCPTDIYSGIMFDGSQCAYIDGVPAGCTCASSYSPQQGHSYCLCASGAPDGG